MEGHLNPWDPATLHAHAGWLRQLAAGLVADPGTADDVVQDTWVAALVHWPAQDRPLRPWLARVARNFAFRRRLRESRRAELELAVEPSADAPTPDQTVERLDLQRAVVEALLSVDEPFRTAIVQRYFEGHSSAEIARLHGVPAGTVRWRLKRGLDELRERLDGRFGSRASWCALLAPLARPTGGAPGAGVPSVTGSKVLAGALAMSAMQWMAVAIGMLLLAGSVWWSSGARGSTPPDVLVARPGPETTPQSQMTQPAARDDDAPAPEPGAARIAVEPTTIVAPVAVPVPAAVRTAAVEARFVDGAGVPWDGVRFEPRNAPSPWLPWGPPVASAADGRVRLELTFSEHRGVSKPIDARQVEFLASRSGCATVGRSAVVRAGETAHLGDVVLVPGVRLSGRILDEQGRGVPNATVGTTAAELPPEEEGRLRRFGSDAFGSVPVASSSPEGTFELDGVGAGNWRLWAHAEGLRYAWSEPITVTAEHDLSGFELALRPLLATDRIAGRVVDHLGEPVQTEVQCLIHHERHGVRGGHAQTDAQGRFSAVVGHDGEVWDLSVYDFTGRYGPAALEGVLPGTLDVVLRFRETQFMEVSVRDAEGRAVDGAGFYVGVGMSSTEAPAELAGSGRYRVPVPDAAFRLQVYAPGFRKSYTRMPAPPAPSSLPAPLEVVLERAPVVRGHVVAEGRAVEGARVELRGDDPDALETVNGFRCVMSALANDETTTSTDAGGRFGLTGDLDGAFWIRVTAAGLAPSAIGPLEPSRLAEATDFEIVLTRGGALEGRVLLPDGATGEGTIVALNHGDGAPRTMRAGPGGFFRFEGLATGSWQVLAGETDLDPMSNSYASLAEAEPIEWSCEVSAGRTTHHDLDLRP